jgi:hypothetical protein
LTLPPQLRGAKLRAMARKRSSLETIGESLAKVMDVKRGRIEAGIASGDLGAAREAIEGVRILLQYVRETMATQLRDGNLEDMTTEQAQQAIYNIQILEGSLLTDFPRWAIDDRAGQLISVKTDWGIVLAVLFTGVVAFFLGVIIARVFPDGGSKPLTDLMIAAVGALAGTAAGAWIALHGDRQRRAHEREERDVMAANIATLQLGRVLNFLDQYDRNVIEPDRSSNLRWFLMARKILKASNDFRVDIGTLGFHVCVGRCQRPQRCQR